MPTANVKLVIIGASGVGKTSFRTKYTTGRFSASYRASIGADFVSKAIPHHSRPDDTVQLQIWDTAGQERFASLATAFFRGADAVILVYDLTDPSSLLSLTKWWDEFRTRVPISEGHEAEFPVAVVGNKLDMVERQEGGTWKIKHRRTSSSGSVIGDKVVAEEEAKTFLSTLIPLPEDAETTPSMLPSLEVHDTSQTNGFSNGHADPSRSSSSSAIQRVSSSTTTPSPIPGFHRHRTSSVQNGLDSRATSRSRYANGTVTTTAMSVYHTASSSLVDSTPPTPLRANENALDGVMLWDPEVEHAIAANAEGLVGEGEVALDSGYRNVSPAGTPNVEPHKKGSQPLEAHGNSPGSGRRRFISSTSNSSVQTIRPSRVNSANEVSNSQAPAGETLQRKVVSKPPLGPGLFFTSAKTGEGINEVFEYIAERVTKKWEWDEYRMSIREGDASLSPNDDSRVILRGLQDGSNDGDKRWGCC